MQVNRAIHFYEENLRVEKLKQAVIDNDIDKFINIINESGESSQNLLKNITVANSNDTLYENCLEICKKINKSGAVRVHGGGFGGTILCIVKVQEEENFIKSAEKYFDKKDVFACDFSVYND